MLIKIGYAYPTSNIASCLGKGLDGTYYTGTVSEEGALPVRNTAPHATYDEAFRAATLTGLPISKWSVKS